MSSVNCVIVFLVLCLSSYLSAFVINTDQREPRRVCVIGAGIAGLTSARYLQDEGINFTVLEATRYIGGTWRYDPRVGTDEHGLPMYTSMYRDLRTNLPKQTMELLGFPVPDDMPPFPSWSRYYDYLRAYTDHFALKKHIKFLHQVTSVRKNGIFWTVKYRNVVTNQTYSEQYDFVFVCTGHYSKPKLPKILGENKFKGTITHSHDYREPERYRNRRVLVVGAGPSGVDIGLHIAELATVLIHSHHLKVDLRTPFPDNWVIKPDVKEFNETGAVFADGTYEDFDDVVYCTGFEYYYPFLDETSGLTFATNYVIPLYLHMVNIHEPTMVIMGLVVRACVVAAIDNQARYATALVKGNFTLPSKEEMMKEWQKRADILQSRGRPMSNIHLLADKEDQYYERLAKESGTVRTPPVFFKIRALDTEAKLENLFTYRNYVYTIIDRETFTRRYEDPKSTGSCLP